MIPDQPTGISDRYIVKFQAAQDLTCQLFAFRSVSLKVVSSILICLFYNRLGNVVKKHGDPEKPVILDLRKAFQDVLAYVAAVMGGILLCFHAGIKFRKKFPGKACLPGCPEVIRMIGYQKLYKLCLDTLCTDMLQVPRHPCQCRFRILFHSKTKLCGKTHRPEHTKSILCKTFHRITNATNDLPIDILHSAKQIHQSMLRMISHGVDGKISSLQIFLKTSGKGHCIRVAAVMIFSVYTVGCYLKALFVHHYGYCSMLDPRIYSPSKKLLHLLRKCGGCDIPVPRHPVQDGIPDTATYNICLIAGFIESTQDLFCFLWYVDRHNNSS